MRDRLQDRSVDPEAWGAFLGAVFDEWVVRDVGTVFVQMFDAALASWLGLPASMCIFGETCGNALASTADVLISVGNRFTDWSASSYRAGVTFTIPPTKLIQLDIDPREIGKN